MKQHTITPLELMLAKNEFFKDCDLNLLKLKDQLRFEFNYKYHSNGSHFNIYHHNRLVVSDWVLEPRDLTSISNNYLTFKSKTLSKNNLVELLSSATGIVLHLLDIDTITKVPGGWLVDIAPDSLRFSGQFKIKNH